MADVVEQVTPHFGPKCPCAVIFRATWPEQKIFEALDTIINAVDPDIERTALILAGNAIGSETSKIAVYMQRIMTGVIGRQMRGVLSVMKKHRVY